MNEKEIIDLLPVRTKPQKKEDFYSYKPVLIEIFVGIGNFRERLLSLAHLWIDNKEVKVLQKRLIKHEGEIFTFLKYPEVEATNNRAERGLRGSVISRKLS